MKRLIALLLAALIILGTAGALAETWTCPNCGRTDNDGAFCPWCGAPVIPNHMGRRKKFCSDRCRWAFWKFETRHRDLKTEMEVKLNENSRHD